MIVSTQYVTETQKRDLAVNSTVQNHYLKHVSLCSCFTLTLDITFVWQKATKMDSGYVGLKKTQLGRTRLREWRGLSRDRHHCLWSGRTNEWPALAGALRWDEIAPIGSSLDYLHLKRKRLGDTSCPSLARGGQGALINWMREGDVSHIGDPHQPPKLWHPCQLKSSF